MHVLRGEVRVVTSEYTIAGRAGDTIYTPDHMPHRDVFPAGSEFEVYLIIFHWKDEANLLKQFQPPQLSQMSDAAKKRIGDDFRRLYQDFLSQDDYREHLTSLQLLQIITQLCRSAAGPIQSDAQASAARQQQIMKQAKNIIDARFNESLSLDTLADALDLSPYYLSHVFSEQSGFTLSSYLTSVRMEKAADLLRSSSQQVGQVAQCVGYRDPQYFSKVFRAHFGLAPSRYRDQAMSE